MLTGDQNIIDIAYSVRWNIRDPELYLFQLAEPDDTIREVAESAMRAVVARSRSTTRSATGAATSKRASPRTCSSILDGYRSGVVDPGRRDQAGRPAARGQRRLQGGHRGAAGRARLHQPGQRLCAPADRQKAQGEAAAFDKVYEQYKLAPEVTRRRMYYETMERVLSEGRQDDRRGAGRDALSAAAAKSRTQPSSRREPAAMTDFLRRHPLLARDRRDRAAAHPAQQRSRSFRRPSRRSSSASASRCGSSTATSRASRFGAAGAGIAFRIPFVEKSSGSTSASSDVDMERQQVLSTDQLRLEVDAFARYRIVDPLRMYIRARDRRAARAGSCSPILGSRSSQRARQAAVRRPAVARARRA